MSEWISELGPGAGDTLSFSEYIGEEALSVCGYMTFHHSMYDGSGT